MHHSWIVVACAALLASQVLGAEVESREVVPVESDLRSAGYWLGQARRFALKIPEERTRTGLLQELLRAQIEAGDADGAIAAKEARIAENPRSVSAFEDYLGRATIYAHAGRFEEAFRAMKKAREAETHPPGPMDPARDVASAESRKVQVWWTYAAIAEQQARHGDFSQAIATSALIESAEHRRHALLAISREKVKTDPAAALEILKSAPQGSGRLDVHLVTHEARDARQWETFNEAIRYWLDQAAHTSEEGQMDAYHGIAQTINVTQQAQRGPVVDSSTPSRVRDEIVKSIDKSGDKHLVTAASALILLKRYADAQAVMAGSGAEATSVVNSRLAVALAQDGRYEEATLAARNTSPQHSPWRDISQAQARNGDVELALKTAGQIQQTKDRNWAYYLISNSACAPGRFAEARVALERIVKPIEEGATDHVAELKASGLRLIAQKQIDARQTEEARDTLSLILEAAQEISADLTRYRELRNVARGYVAIGDYARASKLGDEIRSAEIFVLLAEEHLQRQDRPQFKSAIRHAEELIRTGKAFLKDELPCYDRIAAVYLRADEPEEAAKVVEQLLILADQSHPSMYKTAFYEAAAAFYAKIDRLDQFWRRISGANDRVDQAFACLGVGLYLTHPKQSGEWLDRPYQRPRIH